MSKTNNGKGRTRNWATVIYDESAPANWQDILTDEKVQAFASPPHDADLNPDGELKKPHRHIILRFSSVKTKEQAQEVFSKIGGVGCEAVKDLRQYARYLCHLDNPDKAQYDANGVVEINGIDYVELAMSASDEIKVLQEITVFVTQNNVDNFAKFMRWCCTHRTDWFRFVSSHHSYYVAQLIKSERYDDGQPLRIADPETGEISEEV